MRKLRLLGHLLLFLSSLYIGIGWMYRAPERMEEGYTILLVTITVYILSFTIEHIRRK